MKTNDRPESAGKVHRREKDLFLLHLNIMVFSFTGILSKFCAMSIHNEGLFSPRTILLGCLILINCGIYAVFWQYILKLFEVNVAYSHSAVYNIWSLIWAVVVFSEPVNPGNLVGTVLIIAGIWVIRNE
jgi:drug/metabolite transporter (DMT)-like permease